MSKRSLEIVTRAEFSDGIANENLKKKTKILSEDLAKKINEMNENLHSENHEVSKFLLIFGPLSETMTSEETFEETDGIVTDTISVVCNLLTDLLKNNIDNLSIPKSIKTTLKVLKKVFKLINDRELKQNAEFSRRTETTEEETSEASGEWGEEQRQKSSEE